MKIDISGAANSTRSQKIILALYSLSGGTNKQVRFEDIAVAAFRNYPSDFMLKGYPEYPDTGDIIHKPLYSELKKAGYVLSGNKFFSLTPKGLEYCRRLLGAASSMPKNDSGQHEKLSAAHQKEIERITSLPAFIQFASGKKDEILDIDFYSYLGVTVRTNKNDFIGRVRTVEDAIGSVKTKSPKLFDTLTELHRFLLGRYKQNIDYFMEVRGSRK